MRKTNPTRPSGEAFILEVARRMADDQPVLSASAPPDSRSRTTGYDPTDGLFGRTGARSTACGSASGRAGLRGLSMFAESSLSWHSRLRSRPCLGQGPSGAGTGLCDRLAHADGGRVGVRGRLVSSSSLCRDLVALLALSFAVERIGPCKRPAPSVAATPVSSGGNRSGRRPDAMGPRASAAHRRTHRPHFRS